MKKYVHILIALAIGILSTSIEACTVPPISRGLYQNAHEQVVDEANIIVLAKAVRFHLNERDLSNESGVFYFEIVELLKGNPPSEVKVRGIKEENYPSTRTTFLNHRKRVFWETKIGRTTLNTTLCTLEPTFSVGSTYLLISAETDDSKHYELITSQSDKWLLFVRNRLELIHNKSPKRTGEPAAWLSRSMQSWM